MRRRNPNKQSGVATLVVTMTLFFAMLLVAVFANRNLVFEQRGSANQYRATQAFEAAEAGLEWAQAQLNNVQRLGADCRASTDAAAATFRDRYLHTAPAAAGFSGRVWNNGGYQGNYAKFHAQVKAGLPASQTPNLFVLGSAARFLKQQPFTV